MKNKKILIMIIVVIAILAIGGGIFAYLFLATDIFKSDKELFSKYISQNIETIQKMENLQTFQIYKKLENENKYESNAKVKVVYSEGGEVSNPLNNLAAKLDIQKDKDAQYLYMDGQILFDDEEYLESEIIKEDELYGIRFSDVVKQFITIRDDENLDSVASDLGVDATTLLSIIEIIDGEKEVKENFITNDEMNTLKEKYTNMIIEEVSKGTFSSNKKTMITYNNNTINAKAYTVNLSKEQVEELVLRILNNIKNETVITKNITSETWIEKIDNEIQEITEEMELPAIKITVYEQNKNTIRTVVEINSYKIVIENIENNGQIKSNIQIAKLDSEQVEECNIEISKLTTEKQGNFNITADITSGDEQFTIGFEAEVNITNDQIVFNANVNYKEDIIVASIKLENEINLNTEFDKKVNLEKKNNVTLNDIDEAKRKSIIEAIVSNVPLKAQKRIELLIQKLEIQNSTTDENTPEYEMSQVDINKFNAKFEFYTGNEVSSENVKALLDVVKDNLGSYEINLLENQENDEEIDEDELKYTIKLNIEKNNENEEGINKILEKVKDDVKYKVSISYKEENQLIDYIVIEEVEEN